MKVGILTGGGDCPGLNAVIRAVVKKGEKLGHTLYGIRNGWRGLIDGQIEPLTSYSVAGILQKGGTILGTSRTNPAKDTERLQRCKDNYRRYGLEALIAIGGEDTLGAGARLAQEGFQVVGVPKTIDNDLPGTDQTFGFDTCINIVTEAIDRMHSTAESHQRVMVVEVMGRNTGWIATASGLAGGADFIIVPERPYDIRELCDVIQKRHARGKKFSIIVVAEGARALGSNGQELQDDRVDEFGHTHLGGIGAKVAKDIQQHAGIETRVTILGHVQRGGTPSALDRLLATRFGLAAMQLVHEGKFGRMVALRGTRIEDVPLADVVGKMRTLDMDLYKDAEVFFG
jgi:6-phosphofructokinase 1